MRGPAKTALLGVLFSALIAPGCLEELLEFFPDDDWGNNHSFDTAANITDEESNPLSGGLVFSSTDYFYIDFMSGGTELVIDCTPITFDLSGLTLSIYDKDRNPLTADSVTDAGGIRTLKYNDSGSGVLAERYYILVEGTGSVPSADYGLEWNLTP